MSSPNGDPPAGDGAAVVTDDSPSACFIRRGCERGWTFIEVHAIGDPGTKGDGKQPVGLEWQKRSPVTAAVALGWFRRGQNSGLLPGKSKLGVLDVEPDGLDIWPRSRIPAGALAVSSAAGDVGAFHLYFDLAAVERVLGRELGKERVKGAELFGRTGQVLVPSSRAITEKGGPRREGIYEVLQDGEPISDEALIRELLAPFIERARGSVPNDPPPDAPGVVEIVWPATEPSDAYGRCALERALRAIASAPQGSRQNTFLAQATGIFELVAGGEVDATQAEMRLRSAYEAALPDEFDDLDRRMDWARKKGNANPRRAPGRDVRVQVAPTARPTPPGPPPGQGTLLAARPPTSAASQQPPHQLKAAAPEREIRWFTPGELPDRDPDADLVRDFLAPGELACIAGASGSGKSFLALDLAVAIAGVRDIFLGLRVQKHGVVLYMAAEGFSGLRARVQAADAAGSASARLRFAQHVPTLLDQESVKATLDSARKLIAEELGGEAPMVLVIDTFAQAVAGEDENDNGAMGEAARAALQFARELGCAVILVHHAKKNRQAGDSFLRGAGSLLCALDAAWGVERVAGNDLVRVVTCEKQKDRPSDGAWRVEFEQVVVGKCQTLRIAKVEVLSSPDKERMELKKGAALRVLRRDEILACLFGKPEGLHPSESREHLIRRGVSLPERTLRADLDALRAAQMVDRSGCARSTRYKLTKKGEAVILRRMRQEDGLAADPDIFGPRPQESARGGAGENAARIRQADFENAALAGFAADECGKEPGKVTARKPRSRPRKGKSGKRIRQGKWQREQRAAIRQAGSLPKGDPRLPDSLPPAVQEGGVPQAAEHDDRAPRVGPTPDGELFPAPAVRDPESSGAVGGP